jgi:adenylate cyclase
MLHVSEEDIDRITEAFAHLLSGRTPRPIVLPGDYPDNEIKQVVAYVNRFLDEHAAFAASLAAMSRGDLEVDPPRGRNEALQSLKNLHANLRHLTWKTKQIAAGDFTQTVDFMGDFSEAFNSMTRQLKDAFDTIEKQNQALSQANEAIRLEKGKSDALLLNVLPAAVAEDLKQTGKTTPRLFEDVTVLFSDIVGFTAVSAELPPPTLIEELNDLFTEFDSIAEANDCERIKTIGDAYLAVCGMPEPNESHAANVVRTAVDMVRYVSRRNGTADRSWQIRVGIHTGPVVGAVVGVKKYIYDVFGDTINTASRMESHSEPMAVNVSAATRSRVGDAFRFIERPPLDVKGKGAMCMYFVELD